MTLNVLGVGFGRTGTFALKRALDQVGLGPCHHMYEVRQSREQVNAWLEISEGADPDWDVIFNGFNSQVDWPGSCFWRELISFYPEAKIILTDREPEAWYRSVSQTILPASMYGRTLDLDEVNRLGSEIIYRLVLKDLFDGQLGDREKAIRIFESHRKEVIETVPKERLLVYRVGEGWEPLCRFLGIPIPSFEFPSGNSVAEFRARKPYLKSLEP